tara:strand:+ start:272 stop:1036 length:765 start_codon:yes stop_codon:yes gene_type:complete
MADRIVKPDSGNDLVLQNDDGSGKIEINEDGTLTLTGTPTLPATSFGDNNVTNVGDISLDSISSDPGTSISVTLGTDAGDDFNVGSGKLLVEGDTSLVSTTGDLKVGGNDIQDSGGTTCFTFDGSGNTNMSDKILQRPEVKDYAETVNAIGSASASQTIDLTAGNVITATLAVATTTFTFSNPSASGKACSFTLILTQDGSGSRAVTWPGSVQWAGSTVPTLSTGAADVDVFAFITTDAGTTWFGFIGGLNMDI